MYPPFPPAFQVGPLTIHWYGIIMVTAIFVCAVVASRYVARHGQDGNTIWNLLLWVVIPAILCARLYYVFIQSPRGPNGLNNYLTHPWEVLAIWQGGIHIYGALIGGSIALLTYANVKKLPVLIYLDAVALALPLGQAIGRLGNFMNQELYGPPTTLPWGLRIDPAYRIAPYNNLALYPENTRFQPLFLYEMIWNLAGFALIFWLSRRFEKKLRHGDVVLMYLIWYPLGRFFLEFFRTDSWFFPGTSFNIVHLLSAIVIISSIILLVLRHSRWSGRPAVAVLAQDGVVALVEEEELMSGGGIDMSEEYTFLRRNWELNPAENSEEVEEPIVPEDQIAEEESEGIEDIDDWDGTSPEDITWTEDGEYAEEIKVLNAAQLERAEEQDEESEEEQSDEELEDEDGSQEEEGDEENSEDEDDSVEDEDADGEEESTGEDEGESGENGIGEGKEESEMSEDEAEENSVSEDDTEGAGEEDGEYVSGGEENADDGTESGDDCDGDDDGDAGDASDE